MRRAVLVLFPATQQQALHAACGTKRFLVSRASVSWATSATSILGGLCTSSPVGCGVS